MTTRHVPMKPLIAALTTAALVLVASASPGRGQDSRFEFPGVSGAVHDTAKVFSSEAVRKATAEINRIERETNASILVETVASVGSESVKTVAAANAKKWGRPGLYVLIDKNDHRFEVLPTPGLENVVKREDVEVFRDAFLIQFKRGKFDDGLLNGVQAMGLTLSVAAKEGNLDKLRTRGGDDVLNKLAQGTQGSQKATGLIVRNQVRLTLAGAREIIAGAEAKAAELKLKQNIAVVDDGGHLLSFARMDDARPASGYTAITKATSAATFRSETGAIPRDANPPDALLNLSLQNAAFASGGKITSLHGGIPVVVDGQVIGAVGVGGGTGEQDAEVARAGVNRFLQNLKADTLQRD